MQKEYSYNDRFIRLLISGIVFINGILAIIASFTRNIPLSIEYLLPIQHMYFSRSLHLLLGFILLYFSVQLYERKRIAWISTLAITTLLFILSLRNVTLVSLLFFSGALVLLITNRNLFKIRSEIQNVFEGLFFLGLCLLIAVTYGTFGFWLLDKREFGIDFSLLDSFLRVIKEFTLIGNDDLTAHTRHAHWFLDSLDILGSVSFIFGIYSLFRPLRYKYQILPSERTLTKNLIKLYSKNPEDYFKIWPEDKAYFFDPAKKSVLAYKVGRGVAISCGDPVGDGTTFPTLIQDFRNFCYQNGWLPAFVHVNETLLSCYKKNDFEVIKIGEDALINLQTFVTKTSNDKYFRNLKNKFAKNNYRFNIELSPLSFSLLQELKSVSDEWLSLSGKKEEGFAMGYFESKHIRTTNIFTLRDTTDKLIAFVNEIPSFADKKVSIDLIRYRSEIMSGSLDFLLMKTLFYLQENGYEEFDLGLAPFAGGYDIPADSISTRIIRTIYESNSRFLPFKGLELFKEKYDPVWQPSYFVFKSGTGNLVRASLGLQKVFQIT